MEVELAAPSRGRAPADDGDDDGAARLAELSREFLEPLIEGEGIACHFTRGGRLLLYADADWFAKARLDAEYQATRGLHLRALTAEQCFHHEPALEAIVKRIAGGIFDFQRCGRRLRRVLRSAGATARTPRR